jgi:small subunit ribosomal protein S24e
MDVEIIDEDENPMLHRTDVRFQLTHDEATPSRLSVRDSLAATLNKDAGEVVVHQLDTKYGMRKTVGYAKVYEDADAAEAVEQGHMLDRNKITADAEAAAEGDDAADDADTSEEPEAEAEADADAEEA